MKNESKVNFNSPIAIKTHEKKQVVQEKTGDEADGKVSVQRSVTSSTLASVRRMVYGIR